MIYDPIVTMYAVVFKTSEGFKASIRSKPFVGATCAADTVRFVEIEQFNATRAQRPPPLLSR